MSRAAQNLEATRFLVDHAYQIVASLVVSKMRQQTFRSSLPDFAFVGESNGAMRRIVMYMLNIALARLCG